ncbi:MAG: hypothetical protein EOP88_00675 [Verrucomicrobiaceae bacterium]|nr:MAG: hypothetical protein EOP88_00675 [Verrucomicrobiaceae bacterium]
MPYDYPTSSRFVSDSGERYTVLKYGRPIPLDHSELTAKWFIEIKRMPLVLNVPTTWFIIEPWLENSAAEVDHFLKFFFASAASRNRVFAIEGKKSYTWNNEVWAIHGVAAFRSMGIDPEIICQKPEQYAIEASVLCRLGAWVVNTVGHDPEAAWRLHRLLKDPTSIKDQTNREHVSRNVFQSFASSLSENEALPTKKNVREGAFLSSSRSDMRQASRAFKELGLEGLPEA